MFDALLEEQRAQGIPVLKQERFGHKDMIPPDLRNLPLLKEQPAPIQITERGRVRFDTAQEKRRERRNRERERHRGRLQSLRSTGVSEGETSLMRTSKRPRVPNLNLAEKVFGLVTQPGAASKSASKSQRHRKGEHVSTIEVYPPLQLSYRALTCSLPPLT
mmetsp:Transcript_20502/g.49936  ORF Transcript_20502/g.49936 Transcript_20502/m.49936 type:complete len:161 (+) Transcript_20502:3-485(+)